MEMYTLCFDIVQISSSLWELPLFLSRQTDLQTDFAFQFYVKKILALGLWCSSIAPYII